MDKTSIFRWPMIMGGLFGFVLSMPFINIVNFCTCCSGVIVCGFVAAWMRSKESAATGQIFDVGAGTIAGLIAGVTFGLVSGVVSTVFTMLFPGPAVALLEWIREFAENAEGVPPETFDKLDDAIEMAANPVFSVVMLGANILKSVLLGAVFATVGGLIGGAVFKKSAPAPTAPPTPPTPTAPQE